MSRVSAEQHGPRRRPLEGGYARGDEKRTRIVEAAVRAFGQHGYERASTRQIAQDAGVNPPALQYYFESKEGLYLACSAHMLDRMRGAMAESYAAAEHVAKEDGPDAAVASLCGVLDALADFLFGSSLIEDWSRFLAREQSEGTGPGALAGKRNTATGLHTTCGRLVALVVGLPAETVEVKLRTSSIIGQMTVYHLTRSIALQNLGWPDFMGERLALLKQVVRDQTVRALQGKGSALDPPGSGDPGPIQDG